MVAIHTATVEIIKVGASRAEVFAAIPAQCTFTSNGQYLLMPGCFADFAAIHTCAAFGTGGTLEIVSVGVTADIAAAGTGAVGSTGSFRMGMSECFFAVRAASGADFIIGTSRIGIGVRCFVSAFGLATAACACIGAGNTFKIMTERFSVCEGATLTGLRCFAGGICPIVAKRFPFGGLTNHACFRNRAGEIGRAHV